jgi:hypothetical protein
MSGGPDGGVPGDYDGAYVSEQPKFVLTGQGYQGFCPGDTQVKAVEVPNGGNKKGTYFVQLALLALLEDTIS